MIYVPNLNDYQCVYVRDNNTIRAYHEKPENNKIISYVDYYINSNYIYTEGSQTFSQYTTIPTCINSDKLTDSIYYRNDFDSILIILLIMSIFIFLIPFKIICRLFRRFL